MQLLKETLFLFQKEVRLEWRQKYAVGGILLYVLSTVYIIYASFLKMEPGIWNILFWIIFLFASVNAILKSFQQESGQRQLYYYTLAAPLAILLSKMLYNFLLLLLMSLLSLAALSLIVNNPVQDYEPFLLALLLGSLGFSITFTFISAIATKADNSATLMAILSFPLIIPILSTLIKLSSKALALRPVMDQNLWSDVSLLLGIDFLLLAAAIFLFPYLWRD